MINVVKPGFSGILCRLLTYFESCVGRLEDVKHLHVVRKMNERSQSFFLVFVFLAIFQRFCTTNINSEIMFHSSIVPSSSHAPALLCFSGVEPPATFSSFPSFTFLLMGLARATAFGSDGSDVRLLAGAAGASSSSTCAQILSTRARCERRVSATGASCRLARGIHLLLGFVVSWEPNATSWWRKHLNAKPVETRLSFICTLQK